MNALRRHALLPALAALAALGLAARPAHAQVVVYNNTTTASGADFANGGAVAGGTGPTAIIADDINALAGYAGRQVTQFTFGVYNANVAATTFTPSVYFYNANGAGGGPGTLLDAITLTPITEASGAFNLYSLSSTAGFFALPSGTFWAGLAFSGAPAAQLNSLYQFTYNPPAIGSSRDLLFLSSGPATTANNPSGILSNFGGNPPANAAWAFTVAGAPAPEPPALAGFGLGVFGLSALALRARRRAA